MGGRTGRPQWLVGSGEEGEGRLTAQEWKPIQEASFMIVSVMRWGRRREEKVLDEDEEISGSAFQMNVFWFCEHLYV